MFVYVVHQHSTGVGTISSRYGVYCIGSESIKKVKKMF